MKIPPRLRSLRAIITIWYTGVLLVCYLMFGGAVYTYLDYAGHRAMEEGLTSEVDWIANLLAVGMRPGKVLDSFLEIPPEMRAQLERHIESQAENYSVVLRTRDGRILYTDGDRSTISLLESPAVSGRTAMATIRRGPDNDLYVASMAHESFELHIAVPHERVEAVLRHTVRIMLLMAPFGLLLAIGGGWVLSGVALRPIDRIIDVAERRTIHNLDERIPERDVDDELGRLIRTLNRTADRVQGSYQRIKEFSSNVAHEMKTPLTILRGEAELALRGATSDDETHRLATTYLEETVRLSNMVDDLLTLSQSDADRVSLVRSPVRVDELIDDLYEDATILAAAKNLKVELLDNPPATVAGDAARLRRLFRSLLSNAVRYSNEGGALRIRSWCDAGQVRVSIQDTGIGIPPGSLKKIFERFYRVDVARSRATGGTGLGLALSQWVAEAHGGHIEVASELGLGSTFTVSLPLVVTGGPTL